MEQAGCAAGEQASGPGADAKEHSLVRRLRAGFVSRRPGGSGNPLLGYYGPCARSSLTARHVHRDTQARTGVEASPQGDAQSRSRASRGAPARVMGRSSSGVPADGPGREAGHGVRRSAPAPVGALLPSHFWREREQTKAPPARHDKRSGGALAKLRHPEVRALASLEGWARRSGPSFEGRFAATSG
jgi:hypothetical protein